MGEDDLDFVARDESRAAHLCGDSKAKIPEFANWLTTEDHHIVCLVGSRISNEQSSG